MIICINCISHFVTFCSLFILKRRFPSEWGWGRYVCVNVCFLISIVSLSSLQMTVEHLSVCNRFMGFLYCRKINGFAGDEFTTH